MDEAVTRGRRPLNGNPLALLSSDLGSVLAQHSEGEPEAAAYLVWLRTIR
ncbi:hypothetical protein [Prauserella endophytica]|nr:hypothetical protein [Prauserella endophytica]